MPLQHRVDVNGERAHDKMEFFVSSTWPMPCPLLVVVYCGLASSAAFEWQRAGRGHIRALVDSESVFELWVMQFSQIILLCVLVTPKWKGLAVAKLFPQV